MEFPLCKKDQKHEVKQFMLARKKNKNMVKCIKEEPKYTNNH